mmetsp:Transcript_73158/g.206903  ORF Transcript_73158/g.206903 Transcript_73158/m.206903 type:complete len:288 (-) Transcript_73158:1185-2048(-)
MQPVLVARGTEDPAHTRMCVGDEHQVRDARQNLQALVHGRGGALAVDVALQEAALADRVGAPDRIQRADGPALRHDVAPEAEEELPDGAHRARARVAALLLGVGGGPQQQEVPAAGREGREGRGEDLRERPRGVQDRVVLEDHPRPLAGPRGELHPEVRVGDRAAQHLRGADVGGLAHLLLVLHPDQDAALGEEDPPGEDRALAQGLDRGDSEPARVPGGEGLHVRLPRMQRLEHLREALLQALHVAVPRFVQRDDPDLDAPEEAVRQAGRRRRRYPGDRGRDVADA